VAASLPLEDGGDAPALLGVAACFLPLPVATGLPVHVNGYFELSSNRRDIWCAIASSRRCWRVSCVRQVAFIT